MKTAVQQVFYAVQGEKEADKLTEEIRPTANARVFVRICTLMSRIL